MSQRKGVILRFDDIPHFDLLSDAQLGALVRGLLVYAQEGDAPTFDDPMTQMAFSFLASRTDKDGQKYEEICAKRREAGQKGGRPKKANGFSEKQMVSEESKKSQYKPKTKLKTELKTELKEDTPLNPPKGTDVATPSASKHPQTAESLEVQTASGADSKMSAAHSTTVVATRFDCFWQHYPKKVGKGAAEKAFSKVSPSDALLQAMLLAISQWRTSKQWTKNNGQFIPNPATWLNQRRWEDEIQEGEFKHAQQTESPRDASYYTAGFHAVDG